MLLTQLLFMCKSIPSMSTPPGNTPGTFFEQANFPPPEQKVSSKPQPPELKTCEIPTPGDNFLQYSI